MELFIVMIVIITLLQQLLLCRRVFPLERPFASAVAEHYDSPAPYLQSLSAYYPRECFVAFFEKFHRGFSNF